MTYPYTEQTVMDICDDGVIGWSSTCFRCWDNLVRRSSVHQHRLIFDTFCGTWQSLSHSLLATILLNGRWLSFCLNHIRGGTRSHVWYRWNEGPTRKGCSRKRVCCFCGGRRAAAYGMENGRHMAAISAKRICIVLAMSEMYILGFLERLLNWMGGVCWS